MHARLFLPKLIEDLEAEHVLADAAYYSKMNFRAVEAIDAEPVIACNLEGVNLSGSSIAGC